LQGLLAKSASKEVRERDRWLVEVYLDVEIIKEFLSKRHDVVRLPYSHKSVQMARQFVIIGTTNETEGYLHDATGNRRFWPVHIQHFDLTRLRADRDQLWAEAAEAEALGESIRLECQREFAETDKL
jgi:predicted P-loop ATPase